jgi:hypothetical protein
LRIHFYTLNIKAIKKIRILVLTLLETFKPLANTMTDVVFKPKELSGTTIFFFSEYASGCFIRETSHQLASRVAKKKKASMKKKISNLITRHSSKTNFHNSWQFDNWKEYWNETPFLNPLPTLKHSLSNTRMAAYAAPLAGPASSPAAMSSPRRRAAHRRTWYATHAVTEDFEKCQCP